MRIQFGISTIMVATAFIAVSIGGWTASFRHLNTNGGETVYDLLGGLSVSSPFWMPAIFCSYALGRRQANPATLLAFAGAEATAFLSCRLLAVI
jgi:hypothetical protein